VRDFGFERDVIFSNGLRDDLVCISQPYGRFEITEREGTIRKQGKILQCVDHPWRFQSCACS
jgi:hypothetical protein